MALTSDHSTTSPRPLIQWHTAAQLCLLRYGANIWSQHNLAMPTHSMTHYRTAGTYSLLISTHRYFGCWFVPEFGDFTHAYARRISLFRNSDSQTGYTISYPGQDYVQLYPAGFGHPWEWRSRSTSEWSPQRSWQHSPCASRYLSSEQSQEDLRTASSYTSTVGEWAVQQTLWV